MVAVSVSAQNTRLDDAEATTQWGSIGGGAGGGLETDFVYQNSNCFARKGGTAQRGIFMGDNVTTDLSTGSGTYQTVMFKYICTTPGLLDLLSVPGIRIEIGSGFTLPSTPSTNFYYYDVQGSDTYPDDKSWLVLPIDPNIASHRTGTTGSPTLTAIDYYGDRYDQTGVSKSPNQALDAVDVGAGLTLIGGDGASTDGVWQDFSDYDWNTQNNRFGYVREIDGTSNTFLIYGMMVIGTATATVFNDTGTIIFFPQGLFAAGFSGVTIDLQNATNDIDFIENSFFGQGTEAGEDTRPVLTVTGTSGTFNATDSIFDNFATLTLTSACTITGGKMNNCESVVQSGATLDGVEVTAASTGDGVAFITSNNPANIKNCEFIFSDGHAIEITTTGTYTMDGNVFTGYGTDGTNDAAIYNNSGGAVTINITNGLSPTVRNGAGASTTVNNNVTMTVTVKDENGVAVATAQTAVIRDSDNSILMNEDTNGSGIATELFNYGAGPDVPVSVRVRKGTGGATKYFPIRSPQTITSDGLTVTITLIEDTINSS